MKLDPGKDGPLLPRIFDTYGWSPRQVRYIRGVLRVDTGDGIYALKKSSAEPEQLAFLDQLFSKLKESGYDHLLPWVKTGKGDQSFVEIGGSCWYAQPWYGKAAENGDEVPPGELVKGLARLHKLCQPLLVSKRGPLSPLVSSGLERKKKSGKQLKQWREAALGREFASPFEKALLTHGDYLEKALHFSVEGWKRQKGAGEDSPRVTLVHGRLHPHNLLVGESGWRWIDFDHAEVGPPVADVALFLRRFVRFDRDEVVDPFALLREYEAEYPLNPKEKKLLALHLAYPEGPIRIISTYYSQPSRMEEAEAVRTLLEEMDRLRLFQEWVQSVWSRGRNNSKANKSRQSAGVRSGRHKKSAFFAMESPVLKGRGGEST